MHATSRVSALSEPKCGLGFLPDVVLKLEHIAVAGTACLNVESAIDASMVVVEVAAELVGAEKEEVPVAGCATLATAAAAELDAIDATAVIATVAVLAIAPAPAVVRVAIAAGAAADVVLLANAAVVLVAMVAAVALVLVAMAAGVGAAAAVAHARAAVASAHAVVSGAPVVAGVHALSQTLAMAVVMAIHASKMERLYSAADCASSAQPSLAQPTSHLMHMSLAWRLLFQ